MPTEKERNKFNVHPSYANICESCIAKQEGGQGLKCLLEDQIQEMFFNVLLNAKSKLKASL